MRTAEEIVRFYDKDKGKDFFGFTAEILFQYLSFDQAKPFLKPDAVRDQWTDTHPLTKEIVLKEMEDYMGFAWEKAEGHRGLSAGRSIEKMTAWLWLLGDDEMVSLAKDASRYPSYGAPILKTICEKYAFAIPQGGGIERMMQGLSCRPDCDEGCGA